VKRGLTLAAGLLALLLVIPIATLVLAELAEVVVIRNVDPPGSPFETRIWIVDDESGHAWLRGGGQKRWTERTIAAETVEIRRREAWGTYRVEEVRGAAARTAVNEAMRDKYGLADRLLEIPYRGWVDAVVFRATAVERSNEAPGS
jgi:hypothetical protein